MEIHVPGGGNFLAALLQTNAAYQGPSDTVIPNAGEDQLIEALAALERGEIEYLIVQDDAGKTFMQAAGDAASGYVLEYNDGQEDAMLHAQGSVSGIQITEALTAFIHRDPSWKTLFQWERIRY